jgi:putative ABC transport system permease protein
LVVNDALPMRTIDGEKRFTIRGIMRWGGLASAFGGNLAVMDIYAAQKVFGRGRTFDSIDLAAREGVSIERCQAQLRKLLGSGFEAETPSSRGQQFESMLRVYTLSMNVSSLFALLIGMFIIYNSLLIAVTQRRAEIGILRSLGATRMQIQMLFVGESAVAGIVGSALGAVCGLLIAKGLAGYIAGIVRTLYGAVGRTNQVNADAGLLALAVGVGMVASRVSAFVPARNAASVDPAIALQKGRNQAIGAGENRIRRKAGVMALAALLCLILGRSAVFFYGGYLLMVGAVLLLTPTLALWLAVVLRPVLNRIRAVEGPLAVESIIVAPRRTSSTVAALMLSLAMTIGLGGLARSTYHSVKQWLDATFNAPLLVTAAETGASQFYRFPASMLPALRQTDGIEEVQPVRNVRLRLRGNPVLLVTTDMPAFGRRTRSRQIVAGRYEEMDRLAAEAKGFVAAENFAERQGAAFGDTMEFDTPSGSLRLPMVGIVKDLSHQKGTIFLDQSVYRQYWRDDTSDMFRVYLKPGADTAGVKQHTWNGSHATSASSCFPMPSSSTASSGSRTNGSG